MKKRFAYALVTTLVLGGLVSCGGESTEKPSVEPSVDPTTSVTPSEDPTTSEDPLPADVTKVSIWLSNKDSAAIPALEAAWNKAHPTEKIKFDVSIVEEGDVGNKYTEDPEKTPDIAHVPGDVVSKLYQGEHLASFTEADLEVEGFDVGKGALKIAQDTNGIQYGLPFSANTYFLYYNKANVTAEQAKTLKGIVEAAGENKALAVDLANGWYTQSIFMSAKNGGIFADNGTSATETLINTEAGLSAAKVIRNFYQNEDKYAIGGGEAMKSAVAAGCVSYISGSWDYALAADNWGAENVGMTILPKLDFNGEEREWRTIGDYKSIVVSANSAHKALAKKVAVFLDTMEGQKIRFEANQGSTVPTSASLLANEEFKKNFLFAGVMSEVNASNVYQQNLSEKFGNWWNAATAFCNDVKADVVAGKLTDEDLQGQLTKLEAALLK